MRMILASLEIEREPPRWSELSAYVSSWLQIAGATAAIALVLWGIHYYAESKNRRRQPISGMGRLVIGLGALSILSYVFFLISVTASGVEVVRQTTGSAIPQPPQWRYWPFQSLLLTAAGVLALAAVVLPMLIGLVSRLSPRRIGAIARLSVKEAVRQRVIFGFGLIALVFLFAPYFISTKEEHQIRNYVGLIYTALAVIFLVVAAFLGSFSIPNDVQRQTIHTIVTKPVEKYEIVLGRLFGYGLLLTVMLAILTAVGLGFLMRGVNLNAAAVSESYKARVPVFADRLSFYQGSLEQDKGENVGREWEYRSYIHGRRPGSNEPRHFAAWKFYSIPRDVLATRKPVIVELTLDIFRTTRGKEGQGVNCTLTFVTGAAFADSGGNPLAIEGRASKMREKLQDEQRDLQARLNSENLDRKAMEKRQAEETQKILDRLCEEYGIYQEGGAVITDYHTQSLAVPAGLMQQIAKEQGAAKPKPGEARPVLVVLANINDDAPSAAQYLGMARNDLYVLSTELPFWQNFCKMMIGLWCNTMLVLGVAIACSTYLSGIISLLLSVFLLGVGALVEFIRTVAAGTNVGGGPIESATRLYQHLPAAGHIEKSAVTQLGSGVDDAFRWVLNYILNLVPDIHRFDLTPYVAAGFDIPWGQVIFLDNVLPLLAYLVPWGVLAYYLINYREIANPT